VVTPLAAFKQAVTGCYSRNDRANRKLTTTVDATTRKLTDIEGATAWMHMATATVTTPNAAHEANDSTISLKIVDIRLEFCCVGITNHRLCTEF
jgi:hypothetical protein